MENNFLKELQKLSTMSRKNRNLRPTLENWLLIAFHQPKPLFGDKERAEIECMVEKIIPILKEFFIQLSISLVPDTVETAQRFRSGLQYIVDELGNGSILDRVPCVQVDEYIKNCKELSLPIEYPSVHYSHVTDEQISRIPHNHWWWFVQPISDNDSDEQQDEKV